LQLEKKNNPVLSYQSNGLMNYHYLRPKEIGKFNISIGW